ncbi:hypothetical protein MNBD_GAMMA20-2290, partial [hydrothermal vent metagenome]
MPITGKALLCALDGADNDTTWQQYLPLRAAPPAIPKVILADKYGLRTRRACAHRAASGVFLFPVSHGCLDHLLQFTLLVQLQGDVAATDQFTIDVKLGEGGPVGKTWQI